LRLYGLHAVAAALANPDRPVLRLVTATDAAGRLAEAAAARGLTPETRDRAALDAMLPPGAVHQGVVLEVGPLPERGLDDLPPGDGPLVVLDQVTDPHNVGAILRSAAAFGARAVITQDRHAPAATGALAKAASGALEHVPLIMVTNLSRALEALRDQGVWSVGLDVEAPVTLAEARLTGPLALVLGAEGRGLRRLVHEHCDHLVRLPIHTTAVDSLNVSNACAVALYEVNGRSPT
jgi:23S rRNA (guanosine2251-2'-O)-methyltransferase